MKLLGYWYKLYMRQTAPEEAFERALASRGYRYRTQHPFLKFALFADFALPDLKLVVEIDGDSHNTPRQQAKDLEHTIQLMSDGWRVVRVRNEQVLANPEAAVTAALAAARHETPAREPLYREALARLYQEHPELLAKRTRRPRSPPPGRSTPQSPSPPAAGSAAARPRTRAARPPRPRSSRRKEAQPGEPE